MLRTLSDRKVAERLDALAHELDQLAGECHGIEAETALKAGATLLRIIIRGLRIRGYPTQR